MSNSVIKKLLQKAGFKLSRINEAELIKKQQFLKLFGFAPVSPSHDFCLQGVLLLTTLAEKRQAEFRLTKENVLDIYITGIRFYVNTWEEIYILNEIFIRGIYEYETEDEFVCIDIGMNAGIASLFFANKKNCVHVTGFEPFNKTIEKAKLNFSINADAAKKITWHTTGLGYPERTIEVDYTETYKGSIGIHGISSYVGGKYISSKEQLHVSDAYAALKNLLSPGPYKKLVKIDCEGAEYEIIQRLHETNCLQYADVFIIEWHEKGPAEIAETLVQYGFAVHTHSPFEKHTGMIYAYKQ